MLEWTEALTGEAVVRLLCAAGAGAVLGMERESHGRAAGFRTTILVTVAPCLGMLLSGAYYEASFGAGSAPGWHPDPMRLAAGILAGMGFIGAGTILREGNSVRGVTTAAVLWFACLLGLAFGAGQYAIGALALALALVTVYLLPHLEACIPNDWYSVLTLTTRDCPFPLACVEPVLQRLGLRIKAVELTCDRVAGRETVVLRLKHKRGRDAALPGRLRDALMAIPGIERLEWR